MQVLELGILVHSIIIGISLGASGSPSTIRPLVGALSFHQFFEGIGLGGCIVQVTVLWRSRSKYLMEYVTVFTLLLWRCRQASEPSPRWWWQCSSPSRLPWGLLWASASPPSTTRRAQQRSSSRASSMRRRQASSCTWLWLICWRRTSQIPGYRAMGGCNCGVILQFW